MRAWVRDVGAVLLSWTFLLGVELFVVALTCRRLFAGGWEIKGAETLVAPIALAALLPAAVLVVGLGRLVVRSRTSLGARRVVGALGALLLGAVAVGVTEGRHFASLGTRVPFVVALAALGGLGGYALPRFTRLLDTPRGRSLAAALGASVASLAWVVDAHVLVRLYPAFHTALLAIVLGASSLVTFAWRAAGPSTADERRGLAVVSAAILCCVGTPTAAARLSRADNLRLVLAEHAPVLGRAVEVASRIHPEPPDADAVPSLARPVAEIPRALDWSGDDVLLISVDALRADHVSAYGYARKTTPSLDALAKDGTLFEHAYCPTPHTSYSVTSMMTGKAMRPLLALGLGEDSDTWATDLRRYGYKTAAFYPPAVFYIDAPRFTRFEESGLGFEYRWVEFTSAEEKVHEVERYLANAGPAPLFLWVHLFEPHEPYVMHPSHPFAEGPSHAVDAYDSEVAYADAAIGALVRVVRARRPKATVIVTADHGEEFGDHGGRYHGATCYEEQVRVPLVISGPGVAKRRVATVVQTIDLLPTVLSAMGIPRPARLGGRDLGAVLAAKEASGTADPGLAYAETDDQTLLARGDDRLVCTRQVGACALYDLAKDPREQTNGSAAQPVVARELRALMRSVEKEQGKYEPADIAWPEAIRRGLRGETDSAEDVAALLDDANVTIRRKAAEVTAQLAVPRVVPEAARALAHDEDLLVKRWCALALVRMGEPPSPLAGALVHDRDIAWRRAADVAFALRGDDRGKGELARYWAEEAPPHAGLDTRQTSELLQALGRLRDADAVPALAASLAYVPLRPLIARTLGDIGDPRARDPLLGALSHERFDPARAAEARALLALGARDAVRPLLAIFAGLDDPMPEAITIAREAHLLDAQRGGLSVEPAAADVDRSVHVPEGVPLRVWVLEVRGGDDLSGDVDGRPIGPVTATSAARFVDVPAIVGKTDAHLHLEAPHGILAAWVVARVEATSAPSAQREHVSGVADDADVLGE